MKSPKSQDRPILEAALESAEVVADVLMKGDVIADIPVIGTALKICRAADSIRDRAFAAKLAAFLTGIETISTTAKDDMRRHVNESPIQAQRVGETLFLILERVTDLDKPAILARLFVAYMDNAISDCELRRMAQAVDASYFDDLRQFLDTKDIPKKSDADWMQYLVTTGLTRPVGGQTYGDIGQIYYEATPLGEKMRAAI